MNSSRSKAIVRSHYCKFVSLLSKTGSQLHLSPFPARPLILRISPEHGKTLTFSDRLHAGREKMCHCRMVACMLLEERLLRAGNGTACNSPPPLCTTSSLG